ncbi:hypothetical protein AB5I39_06320 [Sphingomonas sp. MMS24-J45]|uniref:hypothetical protein n=1 Tax=Sphingomonas sp. MMS24-J45 TaxID=3238806 RepID=UPI00384DD5F5
MTTTADCPVRPSDESRTRRSWTTPEVIVATLDATAKPRDTIEAISGFSNPIGLS